MALLRMISALGVLWLAEGPCRGGIVVPSGFTVQTFNIGQELTGLAASAGGPFGTFLYAATPGAVLQINPATGMSTTFATGLMTGGNSPSGLRFDDGSFGTGNLYVSQNNGSVVVVNSGGVVSPFSSGGSLFSSNDLAFAPVGSPFGSRLFVSNGDFSGGTMSVVTSTGANSTFVPNSSFAGATPIGVSFAPAGSSFGGDLYTSVDNGTVVAINSAGQASVFVSGTGLGDAMAFGSHGFGDNLYVTNSSNQEILRVTPGGAVTPFASGFAFTGSAFDGDLAFSPDGNTLYVANNQQLVVITATVPEPASMIPAALGLLSVLGFARASGRPGSRCS